MSHSGYFDLAHQPFFPVFKTFKISYSFSFLCRAKPNRKPKKAAEQYDEDDPEAYKTMEVPDKVGANKHAATWALLLFFTLM